MNQEENTLRVGVFELTDIADQAVQRLVDAGCPADRITLVCSDGASAGSFIGVMTARGVEKQVADYYDRALEKDRILVAVDCTKETAPQAERIFDELGSESIRLPDG